MKDTLLPSLYIRHWLDRPTRDELRRAASQDDCSDPSAWENEPEVQELYGRARPLWRAEIQPLALARAAEGEEPIDPTHEIEPQALIFQRGGFRPANDKARQTWDAASRRFLVRMLWMVPAWHRSVLFKIERIFDQIDQSELKEDDSSHAV